MPPREFLLNKLVLFAVFFLLMYGCGQLVCKYSVKVNYTRKVAHFAMFFLPIFVNGYFPYKGSMPLMIIDLVLYGISFLIFLRPIRDRSRIVLTMFASFDRPEDRPNTIRWLVFQGISIGILRVIMQNLFIYLSLDPLAMNIIYQTLIFGDGLAEPVGIRFGKHKYAVNGFFVRQKYQRSLEGSACVFLACLVSLILTSVYFPQIQWFISLLILPTMLTYTEAKAPHTVDNPFIILVGGSVLAAIMYFF
jgi:phytol kinase